MLTATGRAAGPGAFVASAATQGDEWLFQSGFSLTPNTAVVVSGQVSVLASIDALYELDWFDWEYAEAEAVMTMSGPAAGGGDGLQSASDGRSAYVDPFWSWWGVDAAYGPIAVSFTNATPWWTSGGFRAEVRVSGLSTRTVPEPSAGAVTVAGLLAAGAALARRRRR